MCTVCQLARGIDMLDGCLLTIRVGHSRQRRIDNGEKAYGQHDANNDTGAPVDRHECCNGDCDNEQVTSEGKERLQSEAEPEKAFSRRRSELKVLIGIDVKRAFASKC